MSLFKNIFPYLLIQQIFINAHYVYQELYWVLGMQ